MDALFLTVFDLLIHFGPWILLLMAVAETSFVTGLVVPSGVATSIGTILALEERMPLWAVVVAALAGGWIGDSLGFWVGRTGGEWLRHGKGLLARLHRRHQRTAAPFFGRHPLYSVTLARMVAFVRTLMPMAAGMSPLRYRRFLLYQAPGLVGWAAMYVGIGVLARESWQRVTSVVGAGWAVVFAAAGLFLWLRSRRPRTTC